MPDKQLTIATYAAGASLAAITLVYVFGPTFFIDGESTSSTASSRKKTVVGLHNPANDCFINSVLQALAGLGDLRIYLIRETHRRMMDGSKAYQILVLDPARKDMAPWKIEGLQNGVVTQGLKDMLNALNERPIYKKTISASSFVQVMEAAFKQRISRQQQDAQEFLQIIAERLCDEYHAGHRARNHISEASDGMVNDDTIEGEPTELSADKSNSVDSGALPPNGSLADAHTPGSPTEVEIPIAAVNGENVALVPDDEEGFPLEGGSESQIECLTCSFKPRPSTTTFCSLTLSVPQVSSTTLSSCFDQMFKTEYIEDFKCEKCRLVHALETFQQELSKSNSEKFKMKTQSAIEMLEQAIKTDPEKELKEVVMPDRKFAPKRKIAKHVRITKFPKVMAIHLSRSIFDAGRSTMKNSARVSFPERLPLGGLLEQKFYRLSSVVCHKGSHHSGHYESFRRQTITAPFSTPNTFRPAPVYSKNASPVYSELSTPQMDSVHKSSHTPTEVSTLNSLPERASLTSPSSSSRSLPQTNERPSIDSPPSTSNSASPSTPRRPRSSAKDKDEETGSMRSIARSAKSTLSKVPSIRSPKIDTNGSAANGGSRMSIGETARSKSKKQVNNRWWRISDDKVKECKTGDVLGMQKEVYLLFYELEKEDMD